MSGAAPNEPHSIPADNKPPRKGTGGKRSSGKGKGKGKGKGYAAQSGACFKCGEEGHLARDCTSAGTSEGGKSREGGKGKGRKGGKKGKGKGKGNRPPKATPEKDCSDEDDDTLATSTSMVDVPDVKREPCDTSGHTELATDSIHCLTTGNYECIICVSAIRSAQPTWSCRKCFKIIHLSCTKEWARSGLEGFRCPQCSEEYPSAPKAYFCFCGKAKNPVDDGFSTPHSCGTTCGKQRGVGCPHKCPELCHPGPCPPCTELGVQTSCHCGKEVFRLRCGELDAGRSCGHPCSSTLNCGVHECKERCHSGECQPCGERFMQGCYCGAKLGDRPCDGRMGVEISGVKRTYSCHQKCSKFRDCGKHMCERECHLGACATCELAPEKVDSCPCGKLPLTSLLKGSQRSSCTDPIPVCKSQCGKTESCEKHPCQKKCHEGDCGICRSQITVKCRCQATQPRIQCSTANRLRNGEIVDGQKWPPTCSRRCNATKTCGKHKCNSVCCATAKGGAGTSHTCTEICKRKLACDTHHCEERCHPGACQPCRHMVLEDMICTCGFTILEPPQPCGTQLPQCPKPCTLIRDCGHESVPHECHFGDCPLCAERVEKKCAGDHVVLLVPCHSNPTCNQECGKLLPCGRHKCSKKCHFNNCPSTSETSCGAVCNEPLACGHNCQSKCHDSKVGHSEICKTKVEVVCNCGRKTGHMLCHKYYKEMRAKAGPRGGLGLTKPTLACDDNCRHASRLDGMREALGIDKNQTSEQAFKGVGALTTLTEIVYSVPLWLAAQHHMSHVRFIEKTFQELLLQGTNTKMMPAMNEEKRRIVHQYGSYYNIQVQSVDQEPNRTCELTRNPTSAVPATLLSEWQEDSLQMAQVCILILCHFLTKATELNGHIKTGYCN